MQATVLVGQHDPGGVGVEQLHAAVGQRVQEVDDIEVGHQGVGKVHEGGGEKLFPALHEPTAFAELWVITVGPAS